MSPRTVIELIAALAVAAATAGCGVKSGNPPVVSPKSTVPTGADDWDIDAEISRLFGRSSPLGKLPLRPGWSPDGQRVAYLRPASEAADTPRLELWVYDLATNAERPLFTHAASVDEYAFAGSQTVVVAAGGDTISTSPIS
jgi:hypothetical protein